MSESKDQPLIIGPEGNPIPPRRRWLNIWNLASSKTKTVVGSLVGMVAALAVIAGNLDSIQRYVATDFFGPTIPTISVNFVNAGAEDVGILARGEFIVFFPGPDSSYVVGKYELDPDPSDGYLKTGVITGVVAVRANKGALLRMRS